MDNDIQIGDLVRYHGGRELYLVLKLPRSGWFSSPFCTVRDYEPGKPFADKIVTHEFMKQNLAKDAFQTILMQAQLRSWFSKEEANARKVGPE